MAKSNYLSGVLFIGTLFFFGGSAGFSVRPQNQEPGTGKQDRFDFFYGPVFFIKNRAGLGAEAEKVKGVYDSQLGLRERGSNSGPDVEKYLQYVGLAQGQPWCAAFVCWVYGQAEVENPKSGWSPSLFPAGKVIWQRESGTRNKESGHPQGGLEYYQAHPIRRTTGNPQQATPGTGDVFGIYFTEKKRIAHVGFIDTWDGTWLITVEGNTNESGAREGDGVYRKRRLIRSICQVARYIN